MRRPRTLLVAALVATFVSGANGADAEDLNVVECAKGEPGARFHDGFFFRTDTGLALSSAFVTGSPSGRTAERGIGQAVGLSIGGSPGRGLVIGGTFWTARLEPTFVEDGKTIHPDDDSVKLTEIQIGPMLEWYPDPERGFHLGGGAMFALQSESDVKGNPIRPTAFGAVGSIDLGQDWFMSDEWSAGILGRFTFGALFRAPGGSDETTTFEAFVLSVAATYQ